MRLVLIFVNELGRTKCTGEFEAIVMNAIVCFHLRLGFELLVTSGALHHLAHVLIHVLLQCFHVTEPLAAYFANGFTGNFV